LEIPVCKDILKRYEPGKGEDRTTGRPEDANPVQRKASLIPDLSVSGLSYDPFHYQRRETFAIDNIGGRHVPVVIADLSKLSAIRPVDLQSAGYAYDETTDKWNIGDAAADYIFTGNQLLDFELPGTLKIIVYPDSWKLAKDKSKYFPIYDAPSYVQRLKSLKPGQKPEDFFSSTLNFVMFDCFSKSKDDITWLEKFANNPNTVFCFSSENSHSIAAVRRMFIELQERKIRNPVILITDSSWQTSDEHLIHFATETGALLLDGFGDGICLGMKKKSHEHLATNFDKVNASGRNYLVNVTPEQFINNTAFSILQATRTRISKTEYISCPSCGRTLFDLQETTAKIRSVTNHLKGVKIAIMGCIVNGPGEMADADFGYVGSGPGKITLYKGKDVMKRNVNSEVAVEELINLLKENDAWVVP
jgi:(E)-4-hydroxy-3-methylbut-2-enyl-diphosphate synthase